MMSNLEILERLDVDWDAKVPCWVEIEIGVPCEEASWVGTASPCGHQTPVCTEHYYLTLDHIEFAKITKSLSCQVVKPLHDADYVTWRKL